MLRYLSVSLGDQAITNDNIHTDTHAFYRISSENKQIRAHAGARAHTQIHSHHKCTKDPYNEYDRKNIIAGPGSCAVMCEIIITHAMLHGLLDLSRKHAINGLSF